MKIVCVVLCYATLVFVVLAFGDPTQVVQDSALGHGFDILHGKTKPLSILKLSNTLVNTSDHIYLAPDNVAYSAETTCDMKITANTYYTAEDFRQEETSSWDLGGGWADFGAKLSGRYQAIKETVERESRTVSWSRSLCQEYTLQLTLPYELDDGFNQTLMSMPSFSEQSAAEWFRFLDLYGQAASIATAQGAVLEKYTFTAWNYIRQFSSESATEQASVSFYVDISQDYSFSSQLTKEWNDSTYLEEAHSRGGHWYYGQKWDDWSAGVREDPNYVVQGTYMALPDLFQPPYITDPAVLARARDVEQALWAYLKRPGCTQANSANYNSSATMDDGSCANFTIAYSGTGTEECPFGVSVQAHDGAIACPGPSGGASITFSCIVPDRCTLLTGSVLAATAAWQCTACGSTSDENCSYCQQIGMRNYNSLQFSFSVSCNTPMKN